MHLLLVGMNHRTAGLDQREALAFTRGNAWSRTSGWPPAAAPRR